MLSQRIGSNLNLMMRQRFLDFVLHTWNKTFQQCIATGENERAANILLEFFITALDSVMNHLLNALVPRFNYGRIERDFRGRVFYFGVQVENLTVRKLEAALFLTQTIIGSNRLIMVLRYLAKTLFKLFDDALSLV